MSAICKYCNNTELIFDNAHKSKSGKLIPLEKATGLPHNCSENPYSKGQTNGSRTRTRTITNESTDLLLQIKLANQKLDTLIELLREQKQEQK